MNIKQLIYVNVLLLIIHNIYALDTAIERSGIRAVHKAGLTGSGNAICLIDGGLYDGYYDTYDILNLGVVKK